MRVRRIIHPLFVILSIGALLLLGVLFASPKSAADSAHTGATTTLVGVVVVDDPAVQVSLAAWSERGSGLTMELASSCLSYSHCIQVSYNPYYFEQTGNYGSATGVGDAIRGTCGVTVTMLDSRLLDHEWGHCLGLEHSYTDAKSIVYLGGVGPYAGDGTPDRLDYRNVKAAWAL